MILVILSLATLILLFDNPPPSLQAADEITSSVRHVVDGDSLYLENYEPQIRLWGVDAPERDEPGYDRAKNYLRQLALSQTVDCEIVDTDKYKRSVARCYLSNGDEINRMMIESGAAKEYFRFTKGYYSSPR
ncbi:MAG: thermonuclease family protein [Pseudomonadota bacterium]